MKAIQVDQFSDGFDQVKVIEQEKPVPGPGEILVRMQYAPINPSDLNYIHGTYASALEGVIWNLNHDTLTFDPERAIRQTCSHRGIANRQLGRIRCDPGAAGIISARSCGLRASCHVLYQSADGLHYAA